MALSRGSGAGDARSLAGGIAGTARVTKVRLPRKKECKMLKNLLLRYGFLAALVLAAGAGKKWL
jgi:hypothetical protein